MAVEIKVELTSNTEAIIIARQTRRKGQILPIEPCVEYSQNGQPILCSNLDPKLDSLCKHPDGIMPDSGCLVCPQQKGRLLLLTIPEYGENQPSSEDIIDQAVCPTESLELSCERKRPYRPYFVQ